MVDFYSLLEETRTCDVTAHTIDYKFNLVKLHFSRVSVTRFLGLPCVYNQRLFHLVSCGGTIKAKSGELMSPNYPDNYKPNQNCEWNIVVPEVSSLHGGST